MTNLALVEQLNAFGVYIGESSLGLGDIKLISCSKTFGVKTNQAIFSSCFTFGPLKVIGSYKAVHHQQICQSYDAYCSR